MQSTSPDKDSNFPLPHYNKLCFLKNIITNRNIDAGDYTYYDDFEDVFNLQKNVKYHFDFIGDKLIIGKFCMIGSGVTFIMNGANHLTDAITTYPFAIFNGWKKAMEGKTYPNKGDTIVGNDVWIRSVQALILQYAKRDEFSSIITMLKNENIFCRLSLNQLLKIFIFGCLILYVLVLDLEAND